MNGHCNQETSFERRLKWVVNFLLLVTLSSALVYYPIVKMSFVFLVVIGVVSLILQMDKDNIRMAWKHSKCFVFFVAITFLLFVFHPDSLLSPAKLETQARLLLAFPLAYLLIKYPVSNRNFYLFFVAASIVAGVSAITEVVRVEDGSVVLIARAAGSSYEIFFGDISLVFSVFSVFSLKYFYKRSLFLSVLSVVAIIFGIVATMLSGTRGAWIAIPLVIITLAFVYFRNVHMRRSMVVAVAGIMTALFVCLLLCSPLGERVFTAIDELALYANGDWERGSVTLRLEMWKAAWLIFIENPLIGNGLGGYAEQVKELARMGAVQAEVAEFYEPHNDVLSVMASRGLLGLAFFLSMFLVPIYQLLRLGYVRKNHEIALQGIMFVGLYFVFGVTETVFSEKVFIVIYVLVLALIFSVLLSNKRYMSEA